jgi:hypothetical protein
MRQVNLWMGQKMTLFLTKKNNDNVVIKCVLELFLQGPKKGKKVHGLKKKAKDKMSELKKAKTKRCLSPGSNWGPLVCENQLHHPDNTKVCCFFVSFFAMRGLHKCWLSDHPPAELQLQLCMCEPPKDCIRQSETCSTHVLRQQFKPIFQSFI